MQEFKVVCTNSDWVSENRWQRLIDRLFGKNEPEPVENGIYTVVDIIDDIYYALQEFPQDSYRKECFLPLDEVKSYDYKKEEIEFLN